MKLYTTVRGAARFVVPLFRSATGEMAAMIEADALGQIRTGAASGVATKYLANANARTAGIIGTGYQARTQLEAVAAVRRLERVRAFGRDPERRAQFCREMSARIGVTVEAANSGEEAGARCGHRDHGDLGHEGRARRSLARSRNAHQCNGRELAPKTRIGRRGCRPRPT